MKKIIIILLAIFACSGMAFAQSPLSFKYQAVARDVANQPYQNVNLGIRISLIRNGVSGVIDYSERHVVTTTDLGVFDLQIGNGEPLNGNFANLDWGSHAYYLKVDMDPTGGTSYINMGTNQLLSVPYALYAKQSGSGGSDADADPENELQNLIYDPETQQISISNGNTINLSLPNGGTDDQTLTLTGTMLTIEGGNSIDLSLLQDGVIDDDADPHNEIQSLSFNPATNELTISESNSVTIPSGGTDADADPTNEIQTINKVGNTVTLSDGGGSFTDETQDDDADPGNEIQSLSFNPLTNELSISGSNAVTIPSGGTDADADPTNELQDISLNGTNISITEGSTLDLSVIQDGVIDDDADPGNEIQSLSFNPLTNELSISGSNAVTIPSGGTDADADPTNEIQTISKTGNTVTLSDGGGSFTDATEDADADPGNELQDISFNPTTNELSISNGSTVTLPSGGTDADADPTNELQDISLTGTNLSITDGSTLDLSVIQDGVEDADADPGNELQSLTFNPTTNELSISGTNSVTIPTGGTDADADPTNELQDISLTGTNLSITEGSTLDLSVVQDGVEDADADPTNEIQTITKTGNTVTLSNGGGSFTDATEDADSDPNNEIETWSTLAGIPADIADGDDVDDADADPNNEIQSLSFNATTNELSLSNSNTVTIPTGGADADADPTNEIQSLSLQDNTLTLSNGGGQVTFPTFGMDLPYVDLINIPSINTFDISNAANTGRTIVARQGTGSDLFLPDDAAIVGTGSDGHGVVGLTSGGAVSAGVYGQADSPVGIGVYGRAFGNNGFGGYFESQNGSALVTGSGNVGIGTGFPEHLLDVDGTLHVNGSQGVLAIGYPSNGPRWSFSNILDGDGLMLRYKPGGSNNQIVRMTVKDNGYFGVGQVDPQAPFHVNGNNETVRIGGFSPFLALHHEGTYKGYLWANANPATDLEIGTAPGTSNDLVFSTQAIGRMRLLGNGDFVVNGTTSGAQMTVHHNSTHGKPHLLLREANDGDYARMSFQTGPVANKSWMLEGFLQPSNNNSRFNLLYLDGANATQMLSVTGAGNVGVGNLNPDEDLVVGSNLNTGWAIPAITVGGATGGGIQAGSTGGYQISMESTNIFNRARITSDAPGGQGEGEIEFRTNGISVGDSDPGSPGGYMMKIIHNGFGMNLERAGTGNHWELYTSSVQGALELYFNESFRGSFSHLDGLYVASDRQFKADIRGLEGVMDRLMLLEPSRYQYIDNNPTQKESIGFVAQDVKKLFPELVEVSQDPRSKGMHSLNYASFSVVAIKAIQEQQQQLTVQQETIDRQQSEIDHLKARLARLEALLDK